MANELPWRRTGRPCACHDIPWDYDRPVPVKIQTTHRIIDYLAKISTLNLQSAGDTISIENGFMTNFILHLPSHVGVSHAKVTPTTGIHCTTRAVVATNTLTPRSFEPT